MNSQDLLHKIKWHKPASMQRINIGRARLELLYKAGVAKDNKICGIEYAVHPASPMFLDVTYVIPTSDSKERPIPHKSMVLNRRLSVLAEPFDVVYKRLRKNYGITSSKEIFIRAMRYMCNRYLDEYRPTMVFAPTNWGMELTMLHEAALRNIELVSYESSNWPNRPPTRWDRSARLDYGYLTTEYSKYTRIEAPNLGMCENNSVRESDFCLCMGDRSLKGFDLMVSQVTSTHNKCVIDVYNEQELLKNSDSKLCS